MGYLKTTRMKLIIGLIILFVFANVYKFIKVRISNLDLPKGKIVFSSDIDGDDEIYTMNVNGTYLRQLTKNAARKTNTATDYEPSFSQNGRKIVFVSRRQREEDVRTIYNRRGKAIGESYSGGSFDIYIMDSDGNKQTPLTYNNLCSDPSFSPDGKKIIFRSRRPYSVRMKDINTGDLRLLNPRSSGGEFVFSKDGMKIFDGFKGDISVTDITGINRINLTHFPDSQGTNNRQGIAITISSDGGKIAFITIGKKGNDLNRLFKFYVMNIDGSNLEEIKELETGKFSILSDFKYSPEANKIIFIFDSGQKGIYSLDLVSKNLINLTDNKERWDTACLFRFTFTPDGKKIVFMGEIFTENYRWEYFLHNIKVWTRYLLLWRSTPLYDNKYLCIMDIDGKNYRRITKLPNGTELGRDFIHWESIK